MQNAIGNQSKIDDDLPPLKISCTSSACGNGLHCFLQKQKRRKSDEIQENPFGRGGKCRSCGVDLVEWDRVYKRDILDVAYTSEMLKYELIRHNFWHVEIDQKAINHALRKGKIGMREAAERRIRKSVGDAIPPFDGRQTPKTGNAIFYAQHATAICCRKCIEEWHGIPRGVALNDETISYFTELVMLYINERLPQLEEEGVKVPKSTQDRKKRSRQLPPTTPTKNETFWNE
jgi:hypothetical protein